MPISIDKNIDPSLFSMVHQERGKATMTCVIKWKLNRGFYNATIEGSIWDDDSQRWYQPGLSILGCFCQRWWLSLCLWFGPPWWLGLRRTSGGFSVMGGDHACDDWFGGEGDKPPPLDVADDLILIKYGGSSLWSCFLCYKRFVYNE